MFSPLRSVIRTMSFPKTNTLIVFALEIEERGLFGDFTRIYSGVGKVNAAHHLTRALAQWNNKHGKLPDSVRRKARH